MSWLITLVIVAVLAAAGFFLGRRYMAYRAARLVECPENHLPAAVYLSAGKALAGGDLQLARCSRWPERQGCGQECLSQVERAPEDCMVRTIVEQWYVGKTCAVCGKPVGDVDWFERKPGLMDAGGETRQWAQVAPETIPQVLATHRAVCFDCMVAEGFRRQHPELVLDNPWRRVDQR
jgi:hypothetical protein